MDKRLTHEEIATMSFEEMIGTIRRERVSNYTAANTKAEYSLHYSWDGWTSRDVPFPKTLPSAIKNCVPLWNLDGLKFIRYDLDNGSLKCLFAVEPNISPVAFVRLVKGRLDHAFRKLGTPIKFSRKIGFRTLGDNTREVVNNYVMRQVGKSDYIDPRYITFLDNYTVECSEVDLKIPQALSHGRYWNNIHLVILAEDRNHPMTKESTFRVVRDACFKIADKHGHSIARLAVMPDHIHISLQANPRISPYKLGLSFLNNLSYVLKAGSCWSCEFYVGTFSEYRIDQIK